MADSDFDLRALYDAIDEQRRARYLWLGQPAPSFTRPIPRRLRER